MALLDYLIGKQQDPVKNSQQYFNQASDLYNPFIQHGNQAGDILRDKLSQITQDPNAYYNKLIEGYQPSRGFQLEKDEALQAAANTAAAGGRRGSPQDVLDQGMLAARLQKTDLQDYLNNILGIQKTGLEGQQNLYNQGLSAAGAQGGIYGTQGGLAALLSQQANQQRGGRLGALGGLTGGALGFVGSGFNPMGALAGYNLGSSLAGGNAQQLNPNDYREFLKK
ncbi:hypothetical protein YTPLAS21_19090 [Candidatus Nitrosocosmicus sp.]|nr:hypothetical protein YTPLAS21_19090 [Candidatus Nitrosocosmicus sp.]